jgi:sugar transferase (PEP-CTERM/EpsH1 system associated)
MDVPVARIRICHVVYRFDTGGLENGVVNLVNRLPDDRFEHVIIALTECVPAFCARVTRPDVRFISLHKPPGHGIQVYPQLYRLFRELRPDVVHTRNLGALEVQVPAWLAGVPLRIHGEHGWDAGDPDGRLRKYQLVRRAYRPFVKRYVALSGQIANYLRDRVGVPAGRITRICNGVDTGRFRPAAARREPLPEGRFGEPGFFILGTVGRLDAVKNQLALLDLLASLGSRPGGERLRLVIIGDGPLREELARRAAGLGLADRVWFAGNRDDIPALLRALDLFVLPSLGEGISNTILEAMASGLPVLATRVGGNAELVEDRVSGTLVPIGDSTALERAVMIYMDDRAMTRAQGQVARERIEQDFSLDGMVQAYQSLYEGQDSTTVSAATGAGAR